MPTRQQLLVAGEWRDADSGATHDVVNSYTGKVVTTQAAASTKDVDAAVAAAAKALPSWSGLQASERARVLTRAGDILESRGREIAAAVAEETAGTFGWAMFNVGLAAGILHAAAEVAQQPVEHEVASAVPGLRGRAVRQPLGVCVGIAPWNAPVILGTRAVAWPLAFGNTVVLKASEQSPRVHAAVVAALVDAGAPAGAVSLITNDPADAAEVVGRLIEHPMTAHINFTGSTQVGRIIAEKAAPLFKRTLLELGGKAPLVVLDDADLDAAAAAANFGAFMHSGQICMSTERIVVDRSVAGPFLEKLVARADSLVTGSPFDQGTMIGPVVSESSSRHVVELIEDATSKGAIVVTGGTGNGVMQRPTVVSGVTPEMRLYGEESFGPVVSLITADGVEDAVRVANDTAYGLAAAVFGRDTERALSVATQIQSGICHVNGATVHDEPDAPFGGVKASGWGRFGSGQVAHEFTTTRWITVSEQPRHYPI